MHQVWDQAQVNVPGALFVGEVHAEFIQQAIDLIAETGADTLRVTPMALTVLISGNLTGQLEQGDAGGLIGYLGEARTPVEILDDDQEIAIVERNGEEVGRIELANVSFI